MSDPPSFSGALSLKSASDSPSLETGQLTIERLRQLPSQAETAFESLQALSQHLSENFTAKLVFVSCRDTSAQDSPEMLFDTARSTFVAERAQLYGLELPLDVAIGKTGRPVLWRPTSDISTIGDKHLEEAFVPAAPATQNLIAVPYQAGSLLALCVVHPPVEPTREVDDFNPIAWHCVQYLAEHFRHHPMRKKRRTQFLSPQEERIILRCGAGLTDKEIGREMGISPHTVRTHVNSAKAKLGAKNKTHAVMLFNDLSTKP